MCVIAVKPKNIDFPNNELITKMWNSNPDGAGYMYSLNGAVYIEKGFMTLEELNNALKKLSEKLLSEGKTMKELPFVLHFRITTHGGTSRENTHPFPLSSKLPHLQALDVKSKIALAHNGVITTVDKEENVSDTMVFVRDILYPLSKIDKNFTDKYKALIKNAIGYSKLALLNYEDELTLIGDFREPTKPDGLKYSNLNHEYVYTKYVTPTSVVKSGRQTTCDDDIYNYHSESYLDTLYGAKAPKEFVKGALFVRKEGTSMLYLDDKPYRFIKAWSSYSGEFEQVATGKKVNISYPFLKPYIENDTDSKGSKDRIGGRKNEETANLKQSANRAKYKRKIFEKLNLVSLKPNETLLTNDELLDEDIVYINSIVQDSDYKIKVTSKNWFYCYELKSILYLQKDGTYIQIDKRIINIIVEHNISKYVTRKFDVVNGVFSLEDYYDYKDRFADIKLIDKVTVFTV
jgi:predicted glutamine amidotransferase